MNVPRVLINFHKIDIETTFENHTKKWNEWSEGNMEM